MSVSECLFVPWHRPIVYHHYTREGKPKYWQARLSTPSTLNAHGPLSAHKVPCHHGQAATAVAQLACKETKQTNSYARMHLRTCSCCVAHGNTLTHTHAHARARMHARTHTRARKRSRRNVTLAADGYTLHKRHQHLTTQVDWLYRYEIMRQSVRQPTLPPIADGTAVSVGPCRRRVPVQAARVKKLLRLPVETWESPDPVLDEFEKSNPTPA